MAGSEVAASGATDTDHSKLAQAQLVEAESIKADEPTLTDARVLELVKNDCPVKRNEWKPADFEVQKLDMVFEIIDETRVQVQATMKFKRKANADKSGNLVLDRGSREVMQIEGVQVSGIQNPNVVLTDDKLILLSPGEEVVLRVNAVLNPKANEACEGLYQAGDALITQCEAEGFRNIVPFLDRPDVTAPMTTKIIADKTKYPVILSNGNKVDEGDFDGGRHFATFEDPEAKASYLFALVAGKFEVLEDTLTYPSPCGKTVDLKIYGDPGSINKCRQAMEFLKMAMLWEYKELGIEYDLSEYKIVVTSKFVYGAMENRGLNVFSEKTIFFDPQQSTDKIFRYVRRVVGHEFLHNTNGNRVTGARWFDLAYKEGVNTLRDKLFSEAMGDPTLARIDQVKFLRTLQFPNDSSPNAHPPLLDEYEVISSFYNTTVYDKAAEVARMFRTFMGKDKFNEVLAKFYRDHFGQSVTIHDFVAAMSEAAGIDREQFERTWYSQQGTPKCKVAGEYNDATKTYSLTVEQEAGEMAVDGRKDPYYFPLVIGLVGNDGNDLPLELEGDQGKHDLQRGVLHVCEDRQVFVFKNVDECPKLSALRDFSAPMILEFEAEDRALLEDLNFLMQHDPNLFNRYEAAQQLYRRIAKNVLRNPVATDSAISASFEGGTIDAFREILNSDMQPGLIAEILTLPSAAVLVQGMDKYDFVAAAGVKNILEFDLAKALESELRAKYEELGTDRSYNTNEEAMGKRALKNLCLKYLSIMANDSGKFPDLKKSYEDSNNMTDKDAALRILLDTLTFSSADPSYHESDFRVVRDGFLEEWKDNNVVFNSALEREMGSRRASLSRLRELIALEPVRRRAKSPHTLYSLYGAYARNVEVFHNEEGAYQFIGDKILEIDAFSPHVAVRIAVEAFQYMWKLPEEKKLKLKTIAKEVLRQSKSKNLKESMTRMLNGEERLAA